jgi:hypothetical protein
MKDPVEALELQLDNAEEELVYLRSVNEKHVKSIISLRLKITELEDERNSKESSTVRTTPPHGTSADNSHLMDSTNDH